MSPELQNLINRFNELVAQYNAGHISEEDATQILSATTVPDHSGAVWSISPQGQLQRAATPGDPPTPADPSEWVDINTPRPPQPAFPAPNPLDTPPTFDNWGTPPDHTPPPTAAPIPAAPGPLNTPARSLNPENTPTRNRPAILDNILTFFRNNKAFTAILTIGAIVIIGAVVLPKLNADTDDRPTMPTSTDRPDTIVGEDPITDDRPFPPAVTTTEPTTLDAAEVAKVFLQGELERMQAVVNTELDAPTLLRLQSLWTGTAKLGVVLTPAPAVPATDGTPTATQVWSLTRDGDTEPTITLTVTWIAVDGVWKLTTPPTF